MRVGLLSLILAVAAGSLGCTSVAPDNRSFADGDRDSVVRVTMTYVHAWLANDSGAVMAIFAPDAVIVPSGMEPISGAEAIREFWWPEGGPAAKITAMEHTVDQVDGSGDLAVVRGRGTLSFKMNVNDNEVIRSSRFTFVNVLRRQPTGSWLIAQRSWSDLR